MRKEPAVLIHVPPDKIVLAMDVHKNTISTGLLEVGSTTVVSDKISADDDPNGLVPGASAKLSDNITAADVGKTIRVPDEKIPYPDFGVYKKCRDFDALLRWREEAMMKDQHERFMAMEKPADAVQLPAPVGLELLLNGTT